MEVSIHSRFPERNEYRMKRWTYQERAVLASEHVAVYDPLHAVQTGINPLVSGNVPVGHCARQVLEYR